MNPWILNNGVKDPAIRANKIQKFWEIFILNMAPRIPDQINNHHENKSLPDGD